MATHFILNQGTIPGDTGYCGKSVDKTNSSSIIGAVNCSACQAQYIRRHCPRCHSLGWYHSKQECATCGHIAGKEQKTAEKAQDKSSKSNTVFILMKGEGDGICGVYSSYLSAVKAITDLAMDSAVRYKPKANHLFYYYIKEKELKELP